MFAHIQRFTDLRKNENLSQTDLTDWKNPGKKDGKKKQGKIYAKKNRNQVPSWSTNSSVFLSSQVKSSTLPTDYLQDKKTSSSICTLSKLNELVCLKLSKNKEKLFSPRLNH